MFLETICIENGKPKNLLAHIHRMRQTAEHFGFVSPEMPDIESLLPADLQQSKVKCRIEYEREILAVEFAPYMSKTVRSLKLVHADDIDYSFKFSDRTHLNSLAADKNGCDEILIVCHGCITDTSYSNVVFQKNEHLFTPDTFLLNGTKRQKLLREGVIRETRITPDNLREFQCLYLINAILDVSDSTPIPVENIID